MKVSDLEGKLLCILILYVVLGQIFGKDLFSKIYRQIQDCI